MKAIKRKDITKERIVERAKILVSLGEIAIDIRQEMYYFKPIIKFIKN